MEFQKIVSFLNTIFDDKDLPRSVTEKWIEVYGQEKITTLKKKLELKRQC